MLVKVLVIVGVVVAICVGMVVMGKVCDSKKGKENPSA